MLTEKIIHYLLPRPFLMDIVKAVLCHPLVVNNKLYRDYNLRAAKKFASKYPQGVMGVSLETTLNCNSKCLMCYRRYKEMSGIMSMDLFKKIIDDCAANHISNIGLSVYGEPLMDPYLFERIAYLRKYNMTYGFFTNGNLLDAEKAQKFFALGGLKSINFSVNGYSAEIYERIMVGLKRDVTYKNIINFLRLKEEYRQNDLEVSISIVKLNLNRHEIRKFVKFWEGQKGVNQILTADLWDRVGDNNALEIGGLGAAHNKNNWKEPCRSLWGIIYVYCDGRVAPCCDDNDERKLIVGDMNKQSLQQIFSGERMQSLRNLHLEGKRSLHPVCGKCYHGRVWL